MNVKLFKKFKSAGFLVTTLLIAAGFTSCENFLHGEKIRRQIEEAIAYANAPEFTITIDYPESCGAVKAPAGGQTKKKVSDDFTISFDTFSDYKFLRWAVIDKSTGKEVFDKTYLYIIEPDKAETTCVFYREPPADSELCISVIVAERPQIISNSPLTSGVVKDSGIQVLFDRDMDSNSIYYTEDEVTQLYNSGIPYENFIPPVEDNTPWYAYHYGYKIDDETFYKNISIKNKITGQNITGCFGKPVFENQSTLSIPVVEKDGIDDYMQVLVTIEKDFYYTIPRDGRIPEKTIEMSSSKKWMYQVSDKTDTKPLVIVKSGGNDLSYLRQSSANGQLIPQTSYLSIDKNGNGIETLSFLKDNNLYIDLQVQESEAGSGPMPYFDIFLKKLYDENYSSCYAPSDYFTYQIPAYYQAVTSEVGVFKEQVNWWTPDEGVYQLYYRFYDRSGNKSDYPSVEGTTGSFYYFAIDNSFEMETPVITDKSDYTGAKVELSWKPCIDYAKSEIRYKKHVDDNWSETLTIPKGTNSLVLPVSANESLELSTEYDFEITCFDYAGHNQTFDLTHQTNDWSITIATTEETKTIYLRGENFDKTGITVTYNDLINGTTRELLSGDWSTDFDSSELSTGKNVNISFVDLQSGKTMSVPVGKTYYIAESDALTQKPVKLIDYYGSLAYVNQLALMLGQASPDYYCYKFGDYPQIEAPYINENAVTAEPVYNGWYLGTDGYFYAKYGEDYFKVEPIIWSPIAEDKQSNQITLISEKILNAVPFYSYTCSRSINGETIYPNNYEYSYVRAYLNGLTYPISQSGGDEPEQQDELIDKGLLQTAFTPAAQALIIPESTFGLNDKLFLPDATQLFLDLEETISSYSEEELAQIGIYYDKDRIISTIQFIRQRSITGYAVANDAVADNSGQVNGIWWTRTKASGDQNNSNVNVEFISANGSIKNNLNANHAYAGIVPAMILSSSDLTD